jgi:hypothetical protein
MGWSATPLALLLLSHDEMCHRVWQPTSTPAVGSSKGDHRGLCTASSRHHIRRSCHPRVGVMLVIAGLVSQDPNCQATRQSRYRCSLRRSRTGCAQGLRTLKKRIKHQPGHHAQLRRAPCCSPLAHRDQARWMWSELAGQTRQQADHGSFAGPIGAQ